MRYTSNNDLAELIREDFKRRRTTNLSKMKWNEFSQEMDKWKPAMDLLYDSDFGVYCFYVKYLNELDKKMAYKEIQAMQANENTD